MLKKYDIEIRDKANFKKEVNGILIKLHNDAAHYILVGSKQHVSIHKLRVKLKKIRGIIRLLRHEIGEDKYHELNACYRNIAQQVAQLRDFTSQIELLEKLKSKETSASLKLTLTKIIRSLTKQRKKAYGLFLKENKAAGTQQNILFAKEATQQLSFCGKPEVFILKSLKRVYKKARRTQEAGDLWQNKAQFHYWRKQVKYLMFQLMMLNKAWPEYLELHINELKKLGKTLGKLHDMYLFSEMLNNEAPVPLNKNEKSELLKFIASEKQILQQKAERIGERIFVENSRVFVNRLYKLWLLN